MRESTFGALHFSRLIYKAVASMTWESNSRIFAMLRVSYSVYVMSNKRSPQGLKPVDLAPVTAWLKAMPSRRRSQDSV
jgi:hypothetical protein